VKQTVGRPLTPQVIDKVSDELEAVQKAMELSRI
jgi:hypothetical protein